MGATRSTAESRSTLHVHRVDGFKKWLPHNAKSEDKGHESSGKISGNDKQSESGGERKPEEGDLIGYNLDTSTMKDIAEHTAMRSETKLNIRLTRTEVKRQTEEETRLQHLEVIEEPRPKNPDLYSDEVDEEGEIKRVDSRRMWKWWISVMRGWIARMMLKEWITRRVLRMVV